MYLPGCGATGWALGGKYGHPPPHFGVGKHKKKTCLRSELDGYEWVFAPMKDSEWLKIGYDVSVSRILTRVLK